MSNSQPVLATASSSTDDRTPVVNENRLGDLATRWKLQHENGLSIRHETGKFLLDMFGTSQDRQKYGNEVMPRVSKELSVSVSELSRMRKFAELCPNLAEFREQHLEADTWTKVKALLPTLGSKEPNTKQGSRTKAGKCTVGDLKKSVAALQRSLDGVDHNAARRSIPLHKELAALRASIDLILEVTREQAAPQETPTPVVSQAA